MDWHPDSPAAAAAFSAAFAEGGTRMGGFGAVGPPRFHVTFATFLSRSLPGPDLGRQLAPLAFPSPMASANIGNIRHGRAALFSLLGT